LVKVRAEDCFTFLSKRLSFLEKIFLKTHVTITKKMDENYFSSQFNSSQLFFQKEIKTSLNQKMLIKSGLKFFSSRKLFLIL